MKADTGKLRDDSHGDDRDPIEELLLLAFPNPERQGCPGATVIEDYGNQRIQDESVWEHISHCSPCFSEFKLVRDARWKREAAQAHQRKRWKVTAIALAVALCCGLGFLLLKTSPRQPFTSQPSLLATIDLSKTSILRGGSNESQELHLPPISKRATELDIVLPPFSGTGHYAVAILRSKSDERALARSAGVATGTDARSDVRVAIDLSKLTPGDYLLATWHDADKALYYYPLRIVE